MKNYVSLIIDIEKSRLYETKDRNELQKFLSICIDNLNQIFSNNIECEITFSAGDELQGLFKDITTAFLYFRLLEILIHPAKLRAGVGIGEWTVKVKAGASTEQDGPTFHNARKAIKEVHKMNLQNIRISSDDDNIMANHLINTSMSLKHQQVQSQNMVLLIMELLYPFTINNTEKYNLYEIKNLICGKFNYKINTSKKKNINTLDTTNFKKFSSSCDENIEIEHILINRSFEESEYAIIKKNISSTISDILGSTRQNVDKIIKRGNSYKIRALDFTAIQYLEQEYGRI